MLGSTRSRISALHAAVHKFLALVEPTQPNRKSKALSISERAALRSAWNDMVEAAAEGLDAGPVSGPIMRTIRTRIEDIGAHLVPADNQNAAVHISTRAWNGLGGEVRVILGDLAHLEEAAQKGH